ncbi:MAG: NAD(P)/FAD-dependent oxidoreductase [Chloroflexota bacterium]|nr:MAG: NAD(P)/FAD-dependent oxidoreductase [Chloroflexota bacterium]
MEYDCIIVGGSFAGLAAARHLHGDVLLIEKGEIGAGQTSACGTPLEVVEQLGLSDSVQQIHRSLVLHTASARIEYRLPEPYCTFDYARFCRGLLTDVGAHVVRAVVRGLDGNEVITDEGRFRGRVLVDASGWRAVLARSIDPAFVDARAMSFGLETEVADVDDEGLHFWLDPAVVPQGMGWLFPAGGRARIGLASHPGDTDLRQRLLSFLEARGLACGSRIHGGYYPWRLRPATLGSLFIVGDAAGQCLALTGEGIRPALVFGDFCGRVIRKLLDGQLTHQAALDEYRGFVSQRQRNFSGMLVAQRLLDAIPNKQVTWLGRLGSLRPMRNLFFPFYERAADPAKLTSASNLLPAAR